MRCCLTILQFNVFGLGEWKCQMHTHTHFISLTVCMNYRHTWIHHQSSFSDRIYWISVFSPNPFSHTEVLLVGYILHWTLLNCYWSISAWIWTESKYPVKKVKHSILCLLNRVLSLSVITLYSMLNFISGNFTDVSIMLRYTSEKIAPKLLPTICL